MTVATFVVPLAAQKNVPSTYAVTNARIVAISGPVIENRTIVVRGGLIAAVGAAVVEVAVLPLWRQLAAVAGALAHQGGNRK